MERIRERLSFGEQSRLSPVGKVDRNHYSRRSELFGEREKEWERKEKNQQDHLVESEVKEMRMELVVLRK